VIQEIDEPVTQRVIEDDERDSGLRKKRKYFCIMDGTNGQKPIILVVDDSETFCKVLKLVVDDRLYFVTENLTSL
jgi:hypothetical protein